MADWSRVYLGRRAGPRLFAPLLETCFGLEAEETSRQLLFLLFDTWGSVRISLATGAHALAGALAQHLEPRTGARVRSVKEGGSGVRLEGGEELAADAVVLAVLPREAARLLEKPSPAERQALESARVSALLHLVVSARQDPPRAQAVWVPDSEGGPLAGVLDLGPSARAPDGVRPLLLVARVEFAARYADFEDDELARMLLAGGERIFPGLSERVVSRRVVRIENAPRFEPGRFRQIETLRREQSRQPERKVFLAGDWLVGPHLEGAVASGERAAADVLAALGSG